MGGRGGGILGKMQDPLKLSSNCWFFRVDFNGGAKQPLALTEGCREAPLNDESNLVYHSGGRELYFRHILPGEKGAWIIYDNSISAERPFRKGWHSFKED